MLSVYLISAFYFLLIFPVFCSLLGYYDHQNKRIYLAVYFYGIKIWSGYIAFANNKAYLHYSNRKASVLRLESPQGIRQQFNLTKGIEFYGITLFAEYGSTENLILPFKIGTIQKIVTDIIFSVLKTKKDFLRLKSNVLLSAEETYFCFSAKAMVLFNLLTLFMIGIKILLEKILHAGKNRKQTQSCY